MVDDKSKLDKLLGEKEVELLQLDKNQESAKQITQQLMQQKQQLQQENEKMQHLEHSQKE